jgi:outer membrane receptor protein involved in Fe transport
MMINRSYVAVFVTTALVSSIAASPAFAQAAVSFNLPAQELSKSLKDVARATNTNVVFNPALIRGKQAPPLKGQFDAETAIARLIAGQALTEKGTGSGTFVISGSAPQGNAGAATEAASSSGEEIVVTAQKYRQSAFNVPISLDVLPASKLQAHAVTNLEKLQYDVPGLYMMDTGTNHAVYLRGVGNYFGNGALVGQYIDDADITDATAQGAAGYATGDVEIYDLNRVEVLRGPQGTLYGDGAIGGVIRYITNSPNLNQFQANTEVAALFTESGAPSERSEVMLNTPVVTGTLGLRIAGQFEHDGGWVDEPAANRRDINDGNLTDIRLEGVWQPAANFKVRATEIIHHHSDGIGAGEDSNGNFTPLFETTLTPTQTDNSTVSNLTMTYDFDGIQLLSSSTHFKEKQDINNEMTNYKTPFVTFWYLYPQFNTTNEASSEELRLSNAEAGPWRWVVGGFYKHFRADTSALIDFGLPGPLSSATSFTEDYGDSSTSFAGFIDSSYALLRRFTVGAGVRYSRDREASYGVGMPRQVATFTSTDPRFYLQFEATPSVNLYATVSKGFRSGGFNSPGVPPYGPESVWSYDLGTKMRSSKYGLQGNVDVFYSSYSNYDVEGFFPPQYEIENAGRARIEGIDADLTWQPNGQWLFGINTELLSTKILSLGAAQNTGFAVGDRLPFAPTYSFTASAERDFRLDQRPAYVEVYYYQISPVQYRITGVPLLQSDTLHFLNLRAGIKWSDNLTLELFAHNLLNDRGDVSPFGTLEGESARPRPRTFGLDLTAKFGGR